LYLTGQLRTFAAVASGIREHIIKPNEADVFAVVSGDSITDKREQDYIIQGLKDAFGPAVVNVTFMSMVKPFGLYEHEGYHGLDWGGAEVNAKHCGFMGQGDRVKWSYTAFTYGVALRAIRDYETALGFRYVAVIKGRFDLNMSVPLYVKAHLYPNSFHNVVSHWRAKLSQHGILNETLAVMLTNLVGPNEALGDGYLRTAGHCLWNGSSTGFQHQMESWGDGRWNQKHHRGFCDLGGLYVLNTPQFRRLFDWATLGRSQGANERMNDRIVVTFNDWLWYSNRMDADIILKLANNYCDPELDLYDPGSPRSQPPEARLLYALSRDGAMPFMFSTALINTTMRVNLCRSVHPLILD
jgi:hypothetical protein